MARLRIVSKNDNASHISIKENFYIRRYKQIKKISIALFLLNIILMGLLIYGKHN